MYNLRTQVQGFSTVNFSASLLLSLVFVFLSSAEIADAQARFPGPAARENNRSMDEYDRTINRMKNDSKVNKEKRLNLFPQINEDFQRIQVLHNEMVRMLQANKALNYDRLADLTDDMRKRSVRLRTNLALPEGEKTDKQSTQVEEINESHLKKSIIELHDVIVTFVANPLFKNLGVVDANEIDKASDNLDDIIDVSEKIKREARMLSKTAKN